MRKFLIRWWLTPNWEQEAHARMMEAWREWGVSPLAKHCGRGLRATLFSAVDQMQVYDDIFHESPEERARRLALEALFSKPIPLSEGRDNGLF